MDGTPQTFATFVGIDVAKDHFDVTWLPQGSPRALPYDAKACGNYAIACAPSVVV